MVDFLKTEEGRDWVAQVPTRMAAKEWSARLEEARGALLVKCRMSSDPEVRATYERFITLEKLVNYLTGK